MISNARNLAPDYKYLTTRLRLEQQRLYIWSAEIGLLKYLEEDEAIPSHRILGLSRSTVLDTLSRIQALTEDFIKYDKSFDSLVPDGDEYEENPNDEESCQLPDTIRFLKKGKHSMPFVRSLPGRLKWASFYKDKYEKLIDRLRELNDVLIDLVDSDARVAISRSTRETNTTILHLHSKIDQLVELIKALGPSGKTPMSPSHCPSNTAQMHELADLACFKALKAAVQAENQSNLSSNGSVYRPLRDVKIDRSDIYLLLRPNVADDRCQAIYRPANKPKQRVWIEWRGYDLAMQKNPDGNSYDLTRVDKLVALLSDPRKPELLRVPNCLGYFDDTKMPGRRFRKGRLGFVFEQPLSKAVSPISLRQLLEVKPKPELTKRIALARAVSTCLMSLHSVDWLHKGLCSANVMFFEDTNGVIDYSSPLLSGFGYARPACRADMTEIPSKQPEQDMYRHPRIHGLGPWEGRQGFKRTFDIYSLGIILVEIATWQTIDELLNLGDPKMLDDAVLASIQKRLLDEGVHIDAVGVETGGRFKDATLSCLMGSTAFEVAISEDETNEHVAARLSQNFYWKVIRPLEEIRT